MKGNWTPMLYTSWKQSGSQLNYVINFKVTFSKRMLTLLNQGETCDAHKLQCTLSMKMSNTPSSQDLRIIWVGLTKIRQLVLWGIPILLIPSELLFMGICIYWENSKGVKCRHTCMFWNLLMEILITGSDRVGSDRNSFVKS